MSDEHVTFEMQGSYRWLLPLMYLLAGWASLKKRCAHIFRYPAPNTNSLFFDGLGPVCRRVKEGAASWRAIDLLYNHPFQKPKSLGAWLDNVWLMSPNAQAVRNRRKIAKNELLKTILSSGTQGEVRILSLACGSAEAVLDAVAEANKSGIRIQCLLIDVDASALAYARGVAEKLGISEQVKTKRANLLGFERLGKIIATYQPRIVEMMGLIDYVTDKHTVALIKTIHDALPVGGIFFTCNIIPNAERVFLRHVINWEMIYRRPGELVEIMSVAGFRNIRTIVEKMNIHVIAIGAKEDLGSGKIPERSSVPITEGMLQ
ncbi:MAG: class I SAM-dependent methyltransferase family protein [Candidatus Uhrbacteria bacterium]|nr:class I SAM-dependent methyltransferase family protein [Candidatus Uhrbacteria bacterium]